jgi:methionyl-tRNA formyltransferase
MGTPQYAKEILQALLDSSDIEVALVVTQPDRKVGRKKEIKSSEVKLLASKANIDILQPERLSDNGVYNSIKEVMPDLIIVAAFGQILPKSILSIAPCINLHASLLPKYRGASPVQQALLNGDEFTGVTAMLMDEGLDTGAILSYRYFKIPTNMVLPELMKQLSSDASMLTIETVNEFDKIKPIEQIGAVSTHCKKIKRSDGEINFDNAYSLYNKYRAFYGWPTIFLPNGTKLFGVELIENCSQNRAGEILSIEKSSVLIGCKIGTVKIREFQPISKKIMGAKAYVIGRGLKVGNTLL